MSKTDKENFDFNVMQENEIKRINYLKANQNLDHKIDTSELYISQILCDGYVGTKEAFDKSYKIMIIAAEARDPRLYDSSVEIVDSDCGFFVKKAILDKNYINNMVERKKTGRKMMNNINRIYKNVLNYISNNSLDEVSDNNFNTEDYSVLKDIAYINIKKVGGYGNINDSHTVAKDGCVFWDWIDYHKELIALQINEIAPNYIVLCGNDVPNVFYNLLMKKDLIKIHAKCFLSEHPLSRSKTEEFIESFRFDKEI